MLATWNIKLLYSNEKTVEDQNTTTEQSSVALIEHLYPHS